MMIALAVTEADLLALEVGQAGFASFDGVEGVQYPARIVSISRLPDTAQGVVTYGVEARILTGAETVEVASQLAVIAGQGVVPGVAGLPEAVDRRRRWRGRGRLRWRQAGWAARRDGVTRRRDHPGRGAGGGQR